MARTSINDDGLIIPPRDLTTVNTGPEDNGRLFNHDGSSSITLTNGSTTSQQGYYMWDDGAGAWSPMKESSGSTTDADTLDGYDSTEFVFATEKGSADGVAELNSNTVVPLTQLPGELLEESEIGSAGKAASLDSNALVPTSEIPESSLNPGNMASGSAASGDVPEADGSGGITWTAPGTSSSSTVSNLSVSNWQVIDVGNNGFPGDRSGGDLAQWIADQISSGGKYVFVLPDGTYDWQRPLKLNGGTGTYDEPMPESFAIVGKPEATLYANMPTDSDRLFFRFGGSSNGLNQARLENIHFDVGNQSNTRDAGIMRTYIAERAYFKNLTLSPRKRLQSDGTTNGDRFCMKVDCVNEDATAVMEEVKFRNGDVFQGADLSVGHAIPIASEDPHVGTNFWIDCYVEGFTDNGFYVRDGHGTNYLLRCISKDCSAGQFRLGRNDHAENIKAVVTSNCDYNSTPLWIQEYRDSVSDQSNYTPGDEDDAPVVVSGFELISEDSSPTNDIIRISTNPTETRLEGGYVRCRTDEYILDATHNTGKVSVRDLTVDDHATGNTRLAAIHAAGDNVSFENLTYRAFPGTESGRSLFWVDGVDRFSVKDSDFQSTYYPLFEVEASSELTMKDCLCENSNSSAYVMRLQSTPAERVTLRYNDCRDYPNGLSASTGNMNHYFLVNNLGLTDTTSS